MKRKRKENNNESGGRKPANGLQTISHKYLNIFEYWCKSNFGFRRRQKKAYENRSIFTFIGTSRLTAMAKQPENYLLISTSSKWLRIYIRASCFWKCVRRWNGYLPNKYVNCQRKTRTRKGPLPYTGPSLTDAETSNLRSFVMHRANTIWWKRPTPPANTPMRIVHTNRRQQKNSNAN